MGGESVYSVARMLGQLLIIGYFLTFLFETDSAWLVVGVLSVMVIASSWIALRTVRDLRRSHFVMAFWALLLGGGINLALITSGVLQLDPWYEPRYMIPLAGMIFSNSMSAISLAAERFVTETDRGETYIDARSTAFKTSLIPVINSLFAVGLVALPGMMTGQILSGVSPLIAARYQIMVMCMLFAASGMSAAIYLWMLRPKGQQG